MSAGKRFLIPFIISLGCWFGVYELILKPAKVYDRTVINSIANQSVSLLNTLGYSSQAFDTNSSGNNNYVALESSIGVLIGPGCDGLVIIALFVLFVLFFPGKPLNKLWYISFGALLLHGLNVLRVSVLAIIMSRSPEWLKFNHDYTFTILTYGIVFLLWIIWVNKFSDRKLK